MAALRPAVDPAKLVAQPHGGALHRGGMPGNAGGPGRPTNELRAKYRSIVESSPKIVAEIVQGVPMVRSRVLVADVVPFLVCASCEKSALKPKDVDAAFAEIPALSSATPKDRIGALEFAAKIGVPPLKEVSAEEVRGRLEQTLGVLALRLAPEVYALIVAELGPIWTAAKE